MSVSKQFYFLRYQLGLKWLCFNRQWNFFYEKIKALSNWPAKPVSLALVVLQLMESASPTSDFGNVHKRCNVFRRRYRRGDVNGKRPRSPTRNQFKHYSESKLSNYEMSILIASSFCNLVNQETFLKIF